MERRTTRSGLVQSLQICLIRPINLAVQIYRVTSWGGKTEEETSPQ
jgi:hypothetical protein